LALARGLLLRRDPVAAVLALLGGAAVLGLPFLNVAPNRLVSGAPVAFLDVLQAPSWWLAGLLLLVFLSTLLRAAKVLLWGQVLGASVLMAGLFGLAAGHASQVALTESYLYRTSLGGAFWVLLLMMWLLAGDALQRLRVGLLLRSALLGAVVSPLLLMLAVGQGSELSILKEYANRSDVFADALLRHLLMVLAALLPTLCLGLPLGWGVFKWARLRQVLFPVLNIIQTIPSIALFGLLMAPLALLAATFPVLGRAGISGVGMAPGVIALTLYSLLPVVRATLAGLAQVPLDVQEAARGMGMTPAQVFWRVALPLALPVLLSGVRTATLAAIGLASVTALIGAGGLGAIMFEGLFSSAQDLVLLGVIPIVVLAVLADAAFGVLIHLTRGPQP
jgi:osmoprotectant transport system permease protein